MHLSNSRSIALGDTPQVIRNALLVPENVFFPDAGLSGVVSHWPRSDQAA